MNTLRRLLGLIRPFRNWVILAVLLNFLTIAAGVALIATSAYLISRAAEVSNVASLGIAIASVRFFAIARAALRYVERFVSHSATFQILAHLRSWFFEAIEPLAPARLAGYRSGDLLTRSVADIETLEHFYIRVVVPPIASALAIAFACLLLGAFDWMLALVLLFFLLLTGVALPVTARRLGRQSSGELIATRAELNSLLVDEVQGVADLLVFDNFDPHRARVQALSRQLNRIQERMALLRGASNALGLLFATLAALSILLIAIPLVTTGDIDGVYLGLLPLAAIASFEAVQPLAPALQQLEANRAAAQRLFTLIDAPPEVSEPDQAVPVPGDHNIDVRDVRFRYHPNEPPVLDGVSFTLPMGQCTALVGPNGSGKSTIVQLLLRFWDYQEGQITIGGRDLRDLRGDDVRALYGVAPQDVHLFNGTLRDNLLLANAEADDEEIEAACRQAQLDAFVTRLPHGYDTLVGENGLLLSGGERQRLAIARVVLRAAPIVILDEPTANLDAKTAERLMHSLEPFLAGRTTLIISHERVAVERADRVIELERGRVVSRDTRPSLVQSIPVCALPSHD